MTNHLRLTSRAAGAIFRLAPAALVAASFSACATGEPEGAAAGRSVFAEGAYEACIEGRRREAKAWSAIKEECRALAAGRQAKPALDEGVSEPSTEGKLNVVGNPGGR
ncbi:MAG: hypothetical protein GC152_11765 [Alphaproteobacteria bacterium]|nr:hypothetical protein [Alphaproteobacteria bacterium]